MAKKAKAKTKRRKAPDTGSTGNPNPDDPTTVPALWRETNAIDAVQAATQNKGTISRVVDLQLRVTSNAKGLRVPYDVLGVPVNPTTVSDISGNKSMFDPKLPPVVENDDLLLFFDPELVPAEYAFTLKLDYEHDVEAVTPKPLVDDKYAGIEEDRKARRHR